MSKVALFDIAAQDRRERGGTGRCAGARLSPSRRRGPDHRLRAVCAAWLLASGAALFGVAQAAAGPVCRPTLTIKEVKLSEMQPPTLERRWTAIVSADAARCKTTAGYFEIGFSRLKETAPELEFREQFIWSTPSVVVGVDFWADEAVESYWIDSIQACPCATQREGLAQQASPE